MIEHKTQMQPTAKQIIGYLDKFVIGQDYAKQVLANVVANRLKAKCTCKLLRMCCFTGQVEVANTDD